MRFIFHHIQKTGGISVDRAAKKVMKVARARDYWADPDLFMRKQHADWYSSHFLFRDYRPVEGDVYFTWIRDPVAMFYSAFWFWRRVTAKTYEFPEPEMTTFINGPLKRFDTVQAYTDWVLSERPNAYPKGLFDLPWWRFHFIGECERMNDSIEAFNERFGTDLTPRHENHARGGDQCRDYRADEVREFLHDECECYEVVRGRQ